MGRRPNKSGEVTLADFAVSAYYAKGKRRRYPGGYSRLPSREAHDGFVSPVEQAWDSKWYTDKDENGDIVGISFKRRYCKGCGTIIRHNKDGLLQCGCGRIFSGKDNDWPIITRYIR